MRILIAGLVFPFFLAANTIDSESSLIRLVSAERFYEDDPTGDTPGESFLAVTLLVVFGSHINDKPSIGLWTNFGQEIELPYTDWFLRTSDPFILSGEALGMDASQDVALVTLKIKNVPEHAQLELKPFLKVHSAPDGHTYRLWDRSTQGKNYIVYRNTFGFNHSESFQVPHSCRFYIEHLQTGRRR